MLDRSLNRVAAIVPAVVVVVLVASFASASAAAKRSSAACDARAGRTVLEDAQARVFTRHATDYACSRTNRSVYKLSGPVSWSDRGSGFELAGSYVAWAQDPSAPFVASAELKLLNVDHGPARTVVAQEAQGQASTSALGNYVLNDHGTLVWLFGGSTGLGPFSAYSHVGASRGRSTLASATNTSAKGLPSPPISELGLSSDGRFVFWIDDGKFGGARIP